MKRFGLHLVIAVFLLASGLWAETQGTFRGEVVPAPRGEHSTDLLYLMGRDGNVRRVVVTKSAVVYAPNVPKKERNRPARRALVPGTEVRVTALVDATSGEWTASRVEVIAHHTPKFHDDDGEEGSSSEELIAPRERRVDARTI
jgi:hypothetical protein